MKIEILYPEICTLYGDKGNTMYLQKCLPDAEFVTTGLTIYLYHEKIYNEQKRHGIYVLHE